MTDHVYKTIEVTGSSGTSIEDAASRAIERSGESLHNLRWFKIDEVRGHLVDGRIDHWQVTLKIGFTLNPSS